MVANAAVRVRSEPRPIREVKRVALTHTIRSEMTTRSIAWSQTSGQSYEKTHLHWTFLLRSKADRPREGSARRAGEFMRRNANRAAWPSGACFSV